MGASRRLREHTRPVRCIAVEPTDALHGLEGLKHLPSSLVPAIHDAAGYDETMRVTTEQGWDMSDRLAREEALYVGHSTGASVYAAVEVAKKLHRERGSGCVVAIACDRGDRYFAPMSRLTRSAATPPTKRRAATSAGPRATCAATSTSAS
jgi:cysteine synthase B